MAKWYWLPYLKIYQLTIHGQIVLTHGHIVLTILSEAIQNETSAQNRS